MTESFKLEQTIATWRSEAHVLFEAGREGLARVDRLISLGLTVIAAAAAAGIANNFPEVLLFAPTALLLLLTYVTQIYSDVSVFRMGRRRIEQLLKDELGRDALIYETYLARYRDVKEDKSLVLATVTYGVLATIAIGGGIYVAFFSNDLSLWLQAAFVISTCMSGAAAVSAGLYLFRVEDRAELAAREWNKR